MNGGKVKYPVTFYPRSSRTRLRNVLLPVESAYAKAQGKASVAHEITTCDVFLWRSACTCNLHNIYTAVLYVMLYDVALWVDCCDPVTRTRTSDMYPKWYKTLRGAFKHASPSVDEVHTTLPPMWLHANTWEETVYKELLISLEHRLRCL